MKIIPIISSLLVVIGCFMPWLQLGALFANRGIDGPDGALMLVAGVISGGLSFYNYSQDKPKNVWLYLVVGVLGVIVALIDLNEVHSRAEKIAEGLDELNSVFGGDGEASVMNFVGSGLYIVFGASLGLILCGLGILRPETVGAVFEQPIQSGSPTNKTSTKKCPECAEDIRKEAKICRFCQYKFSEEELKSGNSQSEDEIFQEANHQVLAELHQMILNEKRKFFGGGMTNEISNLLTDLFTSSDLANRLLNTYVQLYQTDLIEDLKSLDTSYFAIRRNVSVFVDLGIIEDEYPHARKKV